MRRILVAVLVLVACAAAADDDEALARRRTPVVRAVEKARLSVVNISTEKEVQVRYYDPFFGDDLFERLFQDYFRGGAGPRRKVKGPLGSGVIIDAAGYVVTNEHVVRRASNIRLSLADGTAYDATLLAADPTHDIALLKVERPGRLRPIRMGTSSDLLLGETVIAVGNPFGFENSVTSGIISALDRTIRVGRGEGAVRYRHLIQTSALINPGNSGGALLNINGELIGINTAVVGGAQGIGFAIPVDDVRDILAGLLASPRVTDLWLGATLGREPKKRGARLEALEPDGPCQRAGLRVGDRIVAADGAAVRDAYDLRRRLLDAKPGETLRLEVEGPGGRRVVGVTLARRPKRPPAVVLGKRLGVAGQNLTPLLARRLGLRIAEGVIVTEVRAGGAAERGGLRRGDVIVQLGAHRVRTVEDIAALLRNARKGERLYVLIVRGPVYGYTRLTLD